MNFKGVTKPGRTIEKLKRRVKELQHQLIMKELEPYRDNSPFLLDEEDDMYVPPPKKAKTFTCLLCVDKNSCDLEAPWDEDLDKTFEYDDCVGKGKEKEK